MKKAKKFLAVLLSGILLLSNTTCINAKETKWPKCPKISAKAGIVMEVSTGTILAEKNIHEQHYPASTTKLMTALLALENCSLNEIVTFSHDAIFNVEGSSVGIRVGEKITMEDCLYALMLESANEVAYAIAEHIAGSMPAFVTMMNKRAKELGCTNTHFNNPHGLFDKKHYSSAYDLALISKEVLKNPIFRQITSTKMYTIPKTNKSKKPRPINTHNQMLPLRPHAYEGCFGGKTGYTQKARYNLATFAKKDGMELISIIMCENQMSDQYIDTPKLLDFGFKNFTLHDISTGEEAAENPLLPDTSLFSGDLLSSSSPIQVAKGKTLAVLPKKADMSSLTQRVEFSSAALQEGENLFAQNIYTYNGKDVGQSDLLVNYIKPSVTLLSETSKTTDKRITEKHSQKMFRVLIVFVIFLGIILTGFLLYVKKRRKRSNSLYFDKSLFK